MNEGTGSRGANGNLLCPLKPTDKIVSAQSHWLKQIPWPVPASPKKCGRENALPAEERTTLSARRVMDMGKSDAVERM